MPSGRPGHICAATHSALAEPATSAAAGTDCLGHICCCRDQVIQHYPRQANAYFRRAFAHKALGDLFKCAEDMEQAKKLDPKNPHLVVNYTQVYDIECIELCKAGDETY